LIIQLIQKQKKNLENNEDADAFTMRRTLLVDVLCSQAAISIENAKLYEKSLRYASMLEERDTVKNEFLASTSRILFETQFELSSF
jgi:GAF domain-containing protein